MKKILILGSGLVAHPMIDFLLQKGYSLTIASNTPDRAEKMIAGHPNGTSVFWDADDEEKLDKMVAACDIAVSILPYVFHPRAARACLKHHKNLVTTSYVKSEMKSLDLDARAAGVLFLNEMGLDPGIDHMSAMRIIDHIHGKEGAVLEFYSICGALPAPEAADNPFRYKFSWSPKGVILAGNNDALYLKHGKTVEVPTHDLFRNTKIIEFPGVGPLEIYPNRDSFAYKEIYGIPEAQTMFRGTFRYKGWCETLDVLKQLSLIAPEKFDMTGMTFAGMILHQLASTGHPVKSKDDLKPAELRATIAEALHIAPDSHALDAMQWLGLFENTPMHRKTDSTFEVVSDLMIDKMPLGPEERDMVVLQHVFLAAYSDGRKEVIRSRMLDFGSLSTDTSIARTVALPAAIAVDRILNGKIRLTGVHIPVIPEIYEPVLDQLETMNIRMEEKFGLPMDELIF